MQGELYAGWYDYDMGFADKNGNKIDYKRELDFGQRKLGN